MKNKILLGSMTLLSAFILSACGNGEKKTNKTTAATTEVTTTADTSSDQSHIRTPNVLDVMILGMLMFQKIG